MNAEAFAVRQGLGFAAHVTLHWRRAASFNESDWQDRLGRLLDKLKRWLLRRDLPYALAWVNENGPEYGQHTHIMLHLPHPKGRDGAAAFKATVAELEAWIIETEVMDTNTLDRFGDPWRPVKITYGRFGMRNRQMRGGLCSYLIKSMDPKDVTYTGTGAVLLAEALGIKPRRRARPLPPGVQRSGASRNLGITARRAAGWRELASVEELRDRLKPT